MKSINDATWKDAAAIEIRTLQARIEDVCAKAMANPQAMLTSPFQQRELESLGRQAARLADIIDRIDEAKPKRKRAPKPPLRVAYQRDDRPKGAK